MARRRRDVEDERLEADERHQIRVKMELRVRSVDKAARNRVADQVADVEAVAEPHVVLGDAVIGVCVEIREDVEIPGWDLSRKPTPASGGVKSIDIFLPFRQNFTNFPALCISKIFLSVRPLGSLSNARTGGSWLFKFLDVLG